MTHTVSPTPPSSASRGTLRSLPRTPLHAFAGLLLTTTCAVPSSWAETVDAPPSSGTYRSSEGATRTPEQLGEALSITPLPDPLVSMTRRKSNDTQADRYADEWYLQDAWITDIGLLLYNDADNDGFFAAFTLSVDADTRYSDTDVYLTIDMQRPFYAVESLHSSAVFPLYGQSTADEYRIDIELARNYPLDNYDLIIELRDAYDHQVLERVTSSEFSNLRALPLESEEFDDNRHVPTEDPNTPVIPFYNDDIRVDEHAGSFGWLMALAMTLLLLARRHPLTASFMGGGSAKPWKPFVKRALILDRSLPRAAISGDLEDASPHGLLSSRVSTRAE